MSHLPTFLSGQYAPLGEPPRAPKLGPEPPDGEAESVKEAENHEGTKSNQSAESTHDVWILSRLMDVPKR